MKKKIKDDPIIIRANNGWILPNFKEIYHYKDLLFFLIVRGIKAKYAQSVLGVGWAILQPLIQTVIFTIIFGSLAQLDSDGIPYLLFSYSGLLSWNYFSNIVLDASNSLIQNKQILSKVYFPRILLPISTIFSRLVDFSVGLIVLIFLVIYYDMNFTYEILFFPIIVTITMLSASGIGMLLSSLAVQYRDISYAMSFMIRLLMYTAPVVYSISIIPENYLNLYLMNPLVAVVEGTRACFISSKTIPLNLIVQSLISSIIIFFLGVMFFRKIEQKFADVA